MGCPATPSFWVRLRSAPILAACAEMRAFRQKLRSGRRLAEPESGRLLVLRGSGPSWTEEAEALLALDDFLARRFEAARSRVAKLSTRATLEDWLTLALARHLARVGDVEEAQRFYARMSLEKATSYERATLGIESSSLQFLREGEGPSVTLHTLRGHPTLDALTEVLELATQARRAPRAALKVNDERAFQLANLLEVLEREASPERFADASRVVLPSGALELFQATLSEPIEPKVAYQRYGAWLEKNRFLTPFYEERMRWLQR